MCSSDLQPSQPSLADSQISDAASEALGGNLFSDDYTGSSEDHKEEEERSVNTETGMPDTQASDSPKRRKGSRRRRKKQAKRPKRIIRRKEASKTRRRDGRHPDILPISHLLPSVRPLLAFPFPLTFSPLQHNRHNMLNDAEIIFKLTRLADRHA